jgi:hypothetical protein
MFAFSLHAANAEIAHATKKKWMSCNCLGFLNHEVYWEAVGNWMVDFGKMNKQECQQFVNKKIWHADSLAESIDAPSQDPETPLVFYLPFLMTAAPEDGNAIEDDGVSRLSAISALNKHKICQSALMELISAWKLWWGACRNPFYKWDSASSWPQRKIIQLQTKV